MVQELTAEQIRQALQGISVPPQPQIMVDLQMEQVMPNPDLKNIARLISQDPGLSGALLKLVNSPFFGLANRITSIQRAVNLLAILKMAEHICGSHRVLGNQPEDHEWNSIGALVLDYVGLTDYDFENLKGSILELGVGQGSD